MTSVQTAAKMFGLRPIMFFKIMTMFRSLFMIIEPDEVIVSVPLESTFRSKYAAR